MEDRKIVDLYFARSDQAVAETERKYGAYCRSIARGILGSEPDAEECVSDAYLAAWNSIPPHEPSCLIPAYLAAVGRGKAKIPPPKEAFSGIVTRRIVSVSSKIRLPVSVSFGPKSAWTKD